jgi:hypothetical protein
VADRPGADGARADRSGADRSGAGAGAAGAGAAGADRGRPPGEWLRRVGFGLLGVLNLGWGVWAYVAPRHFFDTFPGSGHRWTGAYPPYNDHLVSDLGATFILLGVLLLAAAGLDDRRVSTVVVLGASLFSLLHLGFHATHRGGLGAGDYAASLAALVAGAVVPVALLAGTGRGR